MTATASLHSVNVLGSGAWLEVKRSVMRKRLTAVALAGTVGLAAVGATVLAHPALADISKTASPSASPSPGATPDPQAREDGRIAAIKEALKGLVADKTLTQAQADKVASTLGAQPLPGFGRGGPGGHGGGLFGVEGPKVDAAAAKALGITVDDLNSQLRSGSTLAQIAKKQGKSVDTLVQALVSAAKAGLAEAVTAKRITQDMATQIEKTLEQRVRDIVQNGRPGPGMAGERQWQGRGGYPQGGPNGSSAPSPGASASSTLFDNA